MKGMPEIVLEEVIPTLSEVEVLRGLAFGMNKQEIAISCDMPVAMVGQTIGSLMTRWHTLETLNQKRLALGRADRPLRARRESLLNPAHGTVETMNRAFIAAYGQDYVNLHWPSDTGR